LNVLGVPGLSVRLEERSKELRTLSGEHRVPPSLRSNSEASTAGSPSDFSELAAAAGDDDTKSPASSPSGGPSARRFAASFPIVSGALGGLCIVCCAL
jgi:hypothetical protein